MNKETKIIASITFAVIAVAILFLAFSPQPAAPQATPVDPARLVHADSHMTGTTSAKVTVVEFGDYECPACAEAEPAVEALIAAYGANPDFNFVFRNFPLPQHPNAEIAAEAAEAAGAQGKFWQMHDLLYAKQDEWAASANPLDLFVGYAASLGLDTAKFKADVKGNAYADVIAADQADGNAINVEWTPSFYVNGVLQETTPTAAEFQADVAALLAK